MTNHNQKETNALVIFAAIAVILAITLVAYGDWPEDLKDYGINLMCSIITGASVFYIWKAASTAESTKEKTVLVKKIEDSIKKVIEESEKSILLSISGFLSEEGLKKVSVSDAFDKASSYIKDCDQIYVIGTTKQRQHNGTINYSIDRYLQSTLNRLGKANKIDYRRMTSTILEDGFKNHLSECFRTVENSVHDFKMIMIDDFTPSYTYLIIDKSFLMVSLNQSELDYAAKYHSSFVTEDPAIIERFRNHFTSVWELESKSCTVIEDVKSFSYECKFMEQISQQLSLIRESIKKLPSLDRLGNQHVLSELRQTANRLTGVSNGLLKIKHGSANGNMHRLFNVYLQKINSEHTYKTITFFKFWADFFTQHNCIDTFLDNNQYAITKGATIERILVIPKDLKINHNGFTKEKILEIYSAIITQNLVIHGRINKNGDEKYKFRILFSDKHKAYESKLYNFALIKNEDESEVVIFDPSRDLPIQNTTVSIFDTSIKRDNNVRMEDEISVKERMLHKIENEWMNQELNQTQISFLLGLQISSVILKNMFHPNTVGLERLSSNCDLSNHSFE